jgi:Ca2+-binding RTX toxin-like protein
LLPKAVQHIKVKQGYVYDIKIKEGEVLTKDFDIFTKKVNDDLEVSIKNKDFEATIIFENYLVVLETELSCLVCLPVGKDCLYRVVENDYVTIANDSQIVYLYGHENGEVIISLTNNNNDIVNIDIFSSASINMSNPVDNWDNPNTPDPDVIPDVEDIEDGGGLYIDRTSLVWLDGTVNDDYLSNYLNVDGTVNGNGQEAYTIDGWGGDDFLVGGIWNDEILGDRGNDTIYGGEGNDEINGGKGNDTLWGGDGADTFNYYMSNGNSKDVIKDFTLDDVISFNGVDEEYLHLDDGMLWVDYNNNGYDEYDMSIQLENNGVVLTELNLENMIADGQLLEGVN